MAQEYDKGDRPERPDFRAVLGMDPAANWLLQTPGVEDYLPDRDTMLVPLLLELGEDAVEPFKDVLKDREGAAILGFGDANEKVRSGTLLPVIATYSWLQELLDDSERSQRFREAEKRIVLSSPMATELVPKTELPASQIRLDSPKGPALGGIVVGAVDDGFAFAHERFRTAGGSARIEAVWDMNGDFPIPNAPLSEFTAAEIDTLVAQATVGGIVDEDLAYTLAGLLDHAKPRHKPLAWRASHGTHVLDLAAGSDPGTGGPPIIAAQLPSPVVARTTGELLDFYVWLGVLYILHRAGDRPAVINISFGYDAGPHDGGGLLEKWLSKTVEDRPDTAIVLPAGNAQLSRCHATIDLVANAEVEVEWIVQPDDRTHSIVEIWLPNDGTQGNRMTLTVVQPDGTPNEITEDPGETPKVMEHAGKPMGLLELWQRTDGRRMFRIAIAPTARPQPDTKPLAPAGAWLLRFERGGTPMTGPAEAWVQRDDSLYGYPQRGRQSYFDHQHYVRFDALGYPMDDDPDPLDPPCPVTRTSLLNAIATSENLVVAGGYRERDCRIARYSSGGPNTPPEQPPMLKPDVLLPSDGSVAHPGMLAAGARSGARVAMDGTSVAAPALARHIARRLAVGDDSDRPAVVAAAAASPVTCDVPTAEQRGGHGRLERLDTLTVARFETQ